MMLVVLFAVFFILIAIGTPIAWALGLSALVSIATQDQIPLAVVAQRFFTTLDSFALIAIPLFMLAGVLMIETGMTIKIIRFATLLVGHVRGSLAQVNVVSNVLFAGISGSASADVAASGSILIPAMRREKYDAGFAVALTAAASTIGPIIPPSIMMIIYGSMAGVSIGALFMAGIVPGILLSLGFMTYCYFYAVKNKVPASANRASGREIWKGFIDSALVLVLPVIIIGGIRLGFFSATEAGATAVAYATCLGLFSGTLKVNRIKAVLVDAAFLSTISLMIIAAASAFGWILARERLPALAIEALSSVTEVPIVALFIVIAGLLLIGMFLEASAALIILIPVLVGVQASFGFDPVHFGLIVILTLVVGGITPPIGNLLFISASIARIPMSQVVGKIGAFVLVMIVVIVLIALLPGLATILT